MAESSDSAIFYCIGNCPNRPRRFTHLNKYGAAIGEQLPVGVAHFFIFIHLTLIKLKCIINIIKHKIVFNLILLKEKNNATDSRMDSCA